MATATLILPPARANGGRHLAPDAKRRAWYETLQFSIHSKTPRSNGVLPTLPGMNPRILPQTPLQTVMRTPERKRLLDVSTGKDDERSLGGETQIATSSSQPENRLKSGAWVLYNPSGDKWEDAKVDAVHADGTVDLEVEKEAGREHIQEKVRVGREHVQAYPPRPTMERKIQLQIRTLEDILRLIIDTNRDTRAKIRQRDAKYDQVIRILEEKVEAEKEHRINQLEVALRGRQEANREAKSRLAGTLAKIRVLRSRVSADDAKLTTPTRGQKATPDDTDLGAPRRSGRWTTWGISALAASAAFLAWGFQTALRSHLSGNTDEPAKSNNSRPTQKPVVVLILPDNLSASSAEFLWTLVKALFL